MKHEISKTQQENTGSLSAVPEWGEQQAHHARSREAGLRAWAQRAGGSPGAEGPVFGPPVTSAVSPGKSSGGTAR